MNSLIFLTVSLVALFQSNEDGIPHYWLPEIVVTAKRIKEPLSEVAVDMEVITEEEIMKRGIRTVEELLTEQGFLDVRTTGIQGGLLTVGLRGFPADQSLVLLNGFRLNSPANGCFDFSEIPITAIKRIEIIKNPSSSLYGTNASSGVINIITKDAEKEGVNVEGSGNITEQGAKHIFGDAGYRRGAFKTNINISKRNSDGMRPNSNFNSISTVGKISIFNIINTEFSFGERTVGVPGPVPSPAYVPLYGDNNVYSLFDNQETRHYTGSGTIEKNLGDLSLSSTVGYRKENLNYFSIYEGWPTYKAENNWYYITEQLTGSGKLTYKDICTGVDFLKQEFWAYDSLVNSDKDSLMSDQHWNPYRKTKGFWASLKHRFFDGRVIPSTSFRWDKNSDYPNFLSYSGGILFKVSDNLRIGSSFGKGFRAPTFNELYWPGSGNPLLKPEESFQMNTHIDTRLGNVVFLRISGFQRKVKNSISWINYIPENVDRLTVNGLEVNPTINPFHFLSLSFSTVIKKAEEERTTEDPSLNYSWIIDGREVHKRKAAYIPLKKITGSIELRGGENTILTFTSMYNSDKTAYFYDFVSGSYKTKKIDKTAIYNINILQKLGKSISLSVRIDNLFDKKYKANFGYTLDDKDYPAPDRKISLGFNYEGHI